jgi:hypothetical protein
MPADRYAATDQVIEAGPYLGYQEAGDGLPVTLFWETLGSIQDNHGKTNVFIHLVDADGNIWGKVDRLILAGLWRPIRWNPGFYLRDEYKLPILPGTPPGTYHLEVGLYDFESGVSYGVAKNIGEIILTPPKRTLEVADLSVQNIVSIPAGESLTLVGHDYVDVTLPPGAEIAGKIFWRAEEAIDQAYELEFFFLDEDDNKFTISQGSLSTSFPSNQWRPAEIVGAAYRFRVPALAPPGKYPIMVEVLDPKTGENIGQPMKLGSVTVEAQDRNFELPDEVVPISAVINDELELVGYRLDHDTVDYRGVIGLTLYWRSLAFADTNYTVFVHAVGPDQVIRGQWDSTPAQGASPTSGWIPGEIIEDRYEVPMNKKAPAWKYDIFVGMYNPHNGERLPIYSATSPVSDQRVWLGQVQQLEP